MKFQIFLSILILLSINTSFAESIKGFVKVSEVRELYVDYIPAESGQPTLVILNGLTYNTKSWDKMVSQLKGKGFGILRYDAYGQGETLRRYAPIFGAIKIEDQANELSQLLRALKINKASLMGLSYGGGLAVQFASTFPEQTDKVILVAPYVGPIAMQDATIKMQVRAAKLMNPFLPYTYDQLYDFFLKVNVYTSYPLAEPILVGRPLFIESVFRMTQGVRKMDVANLTKFISPNSIHFVVAGEDEYIPTEQHDKFWQSVERSKKVSRLDVIGAKHKIPEEIPKFSASWVVEIMNKNPEINNAKNFIGNTAQGVAKCGSTLIKLQKE